VNEGLLNNADIWLVTANLFRSSMYVHAFLNWLGSPAVEEEGIAYVLNYCATEIVATIVSH